MDFMPIKIIIMNMRIIYSFNTGIEEDYFKGDNLENNFKFYELSIRLARQYYPVTLYTDEYGASRLGHLVDEVKFLEKDPSNYIWSEPKFEAISRETGDFLHLDGDLFIVKPFNKPDADLYFDHVEHGLYEAYYKDNLENFDKYGIKERFPEWSKEYTGAFNIGIMGFRNDEIKNIYLDRYYSMKEWFFNDYPLRDETVLASMTIGEHGLSCLANTYGWESVPLIEYNQYLHMYSGRKHLKGFVKMVESQLKEEYKTYIENGYNY